MGEKGRSVERRCRSPRRRRRTRRADTLGTASTLDTSYLRQFSIVFHRSRSLILFFIRREKTRAPMSESAKKKKDPSSRKPSHGVVDLLERAERCLEMFLFCFSPLAGVKREKRPRWPFGEYKG